MQIQTQTQMHCILKPITIITSHISCCLAHFLPLTAKNFFRVTYRTGGPLQSHCFQASDAFNKQQWINCIRQAKEAAALTGDQPPETGICLETGLGGQIGPLGETGLSLRCDSGIEDEKGTWGEMETGLCLEGEEGLSGEKEAGGMETEQGVDGEVGLELDEETGKDGETRQTISETETGGEMEAKPGERADWKLDGGGEGTGETHSGGADDVHTPAPPCQEEREEREVIEEEQSGAEEEEEEWEELGMDVGEVDSQTHRC